LRQAVHLLCRAQRASGFSKYIPRGFPIVQYNTAQQYAEADRCVDF
jgi:hypothetical protein